MKKRKTMTSISLHIPGSLAKDSGKIAHQLGVSRAQFIRLALEEAITAWKKKQEIQGILKAFAAMKHDKEYMKEANEIMDGLNSDLPDEEPDEEEEWWTKK